MSKGKSKQKDVSQIASAVVPAAPASEFSVWGSWFIVAGLTLLGGFLRFWKLGFTSLWGDEICFVIGTHPESLSTYIQNYMSWYAPPGHPPQLPLPTLLQHFWMKFGSGDFWVRVPPALMGTLTIPAAFLFGKQLFGRLAGVVTAALVCLSLFLIYYSREIVYYAPLVLFSTLFWALLWKQLECALGNDPISLRGLFLLWLVGSAALLSHLTAVFFATALGSAMLVIMVLALRKTASQDRVKRATRRFLPVLVAFALSWWGVIPFLIYTLRNRPDHPEVPPQGDLWNMLNLPFQLGWGKIWPAAVVFLGCLLLGIIVGIARNDRRRNTIVCLWVIAFVVGGYLKFSEVHVFVPRYVMLATLPILLLAASGMTLLANFGSQRATRPLFHLALPSALVLWLGIWSIQPLSLLYQLPGKPTNWRGIAQTLTQELPNGSIAYFDWYVNVWQHVPRYYQTPGIYCSYVWPVNSSRDIVSGYREQTRALLEKYSDAAYVEAMRLFDTDYRLKEKGGMRWDWPKKYFRQQISFRNEPMLDLDRLGLAPIGINYINMGEVEPVIFYNTREDLIEINTEIYKRGGPPVFRRFGEGFGYSKIAYFQPANGGARMAGLGDARLIPHSSTLEMYNLTDQPLSVKVAIKAVAARRSPNTNISLETLHFETNGQKIGAAQLPVAQIWGWDTRLLWGVPTAHMDARVASEMRAYDAVSITLPAGRTDVKISRDAAANPEILLLIDDIIVTPQR